MTDPKPVSPEQRALILQLCEQRSYDTDLIDFDELTGGGKGSASKLISALFDLPRTDGQETTPRNWTPKPGLYRRGDDLFRVSISRVTKQWYAQLKDDSPRGWKYVGKRVNLQHAERIDECADYSSDSVLLAPAF